MKRFDVASAPLLTHERYLALNSVLATASIVGGAAVMLAATGTWRPALGFQAAGEKL